MTIGLYHCGGELHAIEDRCTHDDGPLCEGEWDCDACEVVCPRHGARFDLRTGSALTLPAYLPVATYPVRVRDDGMIVIDVAVGSCRGRVQPPWRRVGPGRGARGLARRDAWVGARLGAELIGGSLYELEPGDRLWPYHAHHANEEWLIVVAGTPTLRTPDGEQELREGDVAGLPARPGRRPPGVEPNGTPVRVLMLSTLVAPEIVEYLDSGKVGTATRAGSRLTLSAAEPAATTGRARG